MPHVRHAAASSLALLCLASAVLGQGVARPGERYALLIGVREYVNKELKGLLYPEPDVVDVAKLLLADGYRPENVLIMSQSQTRHGLRYSPEGAKIVKELKELLRDKSPADSVLIAFTGHGVQFRGEDELYLCPADARLTDKSSLISVTELYQQLEECQAGFKLLLVDACRNDPLSNLAKSAATDKLESVTQPSRQEPPGGVMAFFSCSPGEQSFEHNQLKHGVFFHFVIDALRGAADFNKNGRIEVEEMVLHARTRVNDFVRAHLNNKQRPEFQGKYRDGVLATVSKTRSVALSGAFARGTVRSLTPPDVPAPRTPPATFVKLKSPSSEDLLRSHDHLKRARKLLDDGLCEQAMEECNEALVLARTNDGVAALAYFYLAEACDVLGDESGRRLYVEMADRRHRRSK